MNEKDIRLLFDVSLIAKGVLSVMEIAAGIAAYFITHQFLVDIALMVTQGELAEDPRDLVANFLIHSAKTISVGAEGFMTFYLISHGVVKLWLISGLLRKRLWYYPVAMGVFGLFIIYQLYRYTFTHSSWLMLLTVLDIIVIVLTWHEYRFLKTRLQPQ